MSRVDKRTYERIVRLSRERKHGLLAKSQPPKNFYTTHEAYTGKKIERKEKDGR